MKVLHVLSTLNSSAGGPVAAIQGLARAQKEEGLSVTVVSTWSSQQDASVIEFFNANGISVVTIGPTWGPLMSHPDLTATMRKLVEAAHVVHIHALWEEIQHQAALACRETQTPYLIRPCGMLAPWQLSRKPLKKRFYLAWRLKKNLDAATAIHFTSSGEAKGAASLAIRAPSVVESNGVSLRDFEKLPPRGEFRRRWKVAADEPLLLFLSRLHPKKGLKLLIPALAATRAGQKLAIAGPDEQNHRSEIEKMVDELGLRERVFFTGMLNEREKIAAYVDADLFVLPSYQENFGNSIIEALACGTPVVISDAVDICDQIRAAGVGAVVPLEVEALTLSLDEWIEGTSLRRQASVRARPFVFENYNWQEIARRWKTRYFEICGFNHAS